MLVLVVRDLQDVQGAGAAGGAAVPGRGAGSGQLIAVPHDDEPAAEGPGRRDRLRGATCCAELRYCYSDVVGRVGASSGSSCGPIYYCRPRTSSTSHYLPCGRPAGRASLAGSRTSAWTPSGIYLRAEDELVLWLTGRSWIFGYRGRGTGYCVLLSYRMDLCMCFRGFSCFGLDLSFAEGYGN